VKVAAPVPAVVLLGPTGTAVAEPPPTAEEPPLPDPPLPGAVPLEDGPTPPVPAAPVPTAPVGITEKAVPRGDTVVKLSGGMTMVGETVVRLMGGGTTVLAEAVVVVAVIVVPTEAELVEIGEQPGIVKVPLILPEPP